MVKTQLVAVNGGSEPAVEVTETTPFPVLVTPVMVTGVPKVPAVTPKRGVEPVKEEDVMVMAFVLETAHCAVCVKVEFWKRRLAALRVVVAVIVAVKLTNCSVAAVPMLRDTALDQVTGPVELIVKVSVWRIPRYASEKPGIVVPETQMSWQLSLRVRIVRADT